MNIGVFDSGYGGLTILRQITQHLPQYNYIYLGDNARAPYGTHSFSVIYQYTLQAVRYLLEHDCQLVILACNTASAKALRTIQQNDLPKIASPLQRVLGIIRPTAEAVGALTQTRHVGLFGTPGTVNSKSYDMEIRKLFPDIELTPEACPMWVPLVENYEFDSPGADYFVKKRIQTLLRLDADIDTIILGCTHYPLLLPKILKYLPPHIHLLPQGEIVAQSLADYLMRHPEIEQTLTRKGEVTYLTTEDEEKFRQSATLFMHQNVTATHIEL